MARVYPIKEAKISKLRNTLSEGSFGERNLFWFDFMFGIPLRVSDALQLKVEDVRGKNELTLTPSKTKRKDENGVKSKGRKITYTIHPELIEKIDEFTKDMKDDEYLFQSREGNNKPISRKTAWEIISKAAKKAGIKENIGCHSTRKTFARIIYEKYDLAFVMEQLGHKDPSSTMHYLHLTDERREERINSLDLYKY